ncbi:MAG: glycerophosphodiester phosphodiesterase [Bryobacteraceae bacterium]
MRLSVLLLTLEMSAAAVEVHGHRGARAVRPENTLPAFLYAIDAGVDVLELDMAVTKDDVVVVSHDPILNSVICTGPGPPRPIRSMSFDQLRQWDCGSKINPDYPRQQPVPGTRVPTLDEVLALAPRGRFHFNIETKIKPTTPELAPEPERFAELVLAVVRKHRLEDRVILQSFDYRTLRAMKKLEPRIRLAALYEDGPADWVDLARGAGASIVSPQKHLVTADKVKAAHAAGLRVVPWTANEPAQWEALLAAGVDAIISDDPAALIAHLKRRGLR